jgi:hypothetical protein
VREALHLLGGQAVGVEHDRDRVARVGDRGEDVDLAEGAGHGADYVRVRPVATWDDVRRIALALPETSERLSRDLRWWQVKDKGFVWERPLRRADIEALGDTAPDGPILGARVEHLVAKEALLADDPDVYFTTPHFDGYPAILVRLDRITAEDLDEVITEAWLTRAPKRLARAYVDAR